jgi:hypothetical protein
VRSNLFQLNVSQHSLEVKELSFMLHHCLNILKLSTQLGIWTLKTSLHCFLFLHKELREVFLLYWDRP